MSRREETKQVMAFSIDDKSFKALEIRMFEIYELDMITFKVMMRII